MNVLTKKRKKMISKWFFDIFCLYLYTVGPKTGFGQNCQKITIFTKLSLKNAKQKHFFNKIQNVHRIWFSHRFSILGSNVAPKRPQDGHDLPLAMKWASFVGTGLLVRIFVSWQRLCINPCVSACAFVLPSIYFSKNHAIEYH